MKNTLVKMTACAVAACLACSPMQAEAMSNLPAAGLGLVLGDGTSLSQLREGLGESQPETQTEQEIQTEQGTEDAQETILETENGTEETESIQEGEESAPDGQETEARKADGLEEGTLIIAQVTDYVNIRSIPSTDGEILGKLYQNSVGYLIRVEGDWFLMKSGNVEGYVKAEFFETGDRAKEIADQVGDRIATVNTETLRVRTEPSLEAPVLGLVPGGEELTVLDEENGFVKVSIEEGDGWVSMEYVILETEYVTAESVKEEKERLEKEAQAKADAKKAAREAEKILRQEEQEREQEAQEQEEAKAPETSAETQQEVPVAAASSLGQAVVNYALQFVGNPYVYGGSSLTNGTDCSGFVMSVYRNFGVTLPHSSSGDRSVGYSVGGLSEAQPGDILCYSGHVGIYIGNGQIVHASTERSGIKVSEATYRKILAIRRIF